ncbi:hypothetical protein XI25_15090 [Paenibacillus sp. DMB20]|nr:hypothetical protein XI25_15090 [Paenibacillus sp. DMB20]
MLAAASTIPKNPNIPAISAITSKMTDHLNIIITLLSIKLSFPRLYGQARYFRPLVVLFNLDLFA